MKVNLSRRFQFLLPSVVMLLSLLLPALVAGQVPLVQFGNSSGVTYQKAATVAFPTAQTAGDLNVVVVGWNDGSSTIASVTDSANNTYVLAAGTVATPLPATASVSQAIYYAKNIVAATSNEVTVTFNSNTGAQDVRIIEYGTSGGGLDPLFPLDTSVGTSGTTSPATSGPALTNSANDLIFGAGTITTAFTSRVVSCGTNCTMFGEPNNSGINAYGDIVMDALVTAIGTYQAEADFNSGAAVMQMLAMRESGQTIPVFPAPTAASVVPGTSPEAGGVAITITGTNFLTGATVIFSDGVHIASGQNCSVASATTITCLTPSYPGTAPTVVVTNVDGQATTGLPFAYTASAPFSTLGTGSVSPDGGSTNGGTLVTITGSDFAAGAKVSVGAVAAEKVQVVNSGTILATFPAGSAGNPGVYVTNPSGTTGAVTGGYTYSLGAGINFIQANYTTSVSASSSEAVNFNLAQVAGDLNVVAVGWGDNTATIQSVTDSAGNTYAVAAPAVQGTGITQAIYYAKNINASAANTVTVTFTPAAANPDIRIVEYNGLDTVNPLDAGGGTFGTGTALDSGPVTLSSAGDLFVGAADVGDVITSPGLGFATAILSNFGNDVEHFFPPAAGAYDATATQGDPDPWVMQGVGFRVSGAAVANFTVGATALSPASVTAGSPATSTVTVTPSGGFASPVTLSCNAGLPTGVTCGFAPNPVTPGASAVTSALTITTTAVTPAGTTTVTITGTSGSVINTTTVSLVVTASTGGGGSFTIAAAPATGTVTPGASTTSVITATGANGFTDTLTLTCAVTPQNAPAPVCNLNPGAVNLSATTTSATSTMTISTTAPTAALRHSSNIFYAMLLPICGMTLLGVSFGSRRKKVLGILLVFLMASGLLFLASCSSSSNSGGGGNVQPGTPAGTYTVTVTATPTSGTAQTTTFTLTVQ